MNELTVTVTGWVATDPRHVVGPTGASLTSFRLASTSRYFDKASNEWADGNTEWFTVRVFRSAAVTVMNSIAKGQPVVVTGRLRSHQWESEAGPRTDLLIDASALGHDLTRGVAQFTRATGDANLGDGGASGASSQQADDAAVLDPEAGEGLVDPAADPVDESVLSAA